MNPDFVASQTSAIGAAIGWLQSALTGTAATSVAIIAVAWLGLMLMFGRLPSRRGAKLILGCFIIFGATPIAAGIVRGLRADPSNIVPVPIENPPDVTPVVQRSSPTPAYDPYAGAALPPRR